MINVGGTTTFADLAHTAEKLNSLVEGDGGGGHGPH